MYGRTFAPDKETATKLRFVMIADTPFTVKDSRKRIQAMSDEQLIRCGKTAACMADPKFMEASASEFGVVVMRLKNFERR
jgi:hypothetical protein